MKLEERWFNSTQYAILLKCAAGFNPSRNAGQSIKRRRIASAMACERLAAPSFFTAALI